MCAHEMANVRKPLIARTMFMPIAMAMSIATRMAAGKNGKAAIGLEIAINPTLTAAATGISKETNNGTLTVTDKKTRQNLINGTSRVAKRIASKETTTARAISNLITTAEVAAANSIETAAAVIGEASDKSRLPIDQEDNGAAVVAAVGADRSQNMGKLSNRSLK
jgi:hypothetical protein